MRHLAPNQLITRNNKSREPFRRVLAHDGVKGHHAMKNLSSVQTVILPLVSA
jgi:hypothetical protein